MNNKKIPLFIFSFIILSATFLLMYYIYSIGGVLHIPRESILNEFGNSLGSFGFLALALVYARTVLKLIIVKGDVWKRLEPYKVQLPEIKFFLEKILFWLNKAHPYFGILAISSIFLHCALTYSLSENFFLSAILMLMILEGLTGMLLEFQNINPNIKKKTYLSHSQLFVGIAILILAIIGHAIL